MSGPDVAVISHLYPAPGHERHLFVHEQVCALRDLGVRVQVVSPTAMTFGMTALHPRLRRRRATPQRAVRDGIVVEYPRVPVLPRRVAFDRAGDLYYATLRRLLPRLREEGVDLLHAHQAMPDGAATRRLAAALGVPYVVTVHGVDVFQHLPAGGRIAARTEETLAAADAVVAVSSKVAARLQHIVAPERLSVNLNGVVGDLEPAPAAVYEAGRQVLLTVGYLIKRKDHLVVLEALALLRDRGVRPVWAVVGDGPLRAQLESRAAALGLADTVDFLGRLPHDRVLGLMARADAFVLPSRDEAFGLVYTEAMAQGTPVVGCRDEGIEDFVEDGVSGILVDPGDAVELADRLQELLTDDAGLRRVGAAGRRAVEQLTWERNAVRQLEIYRRLVRRDHRDVEEHH